MKEQARIDQSSKKYGKEEVLKVLDELHLAYSVKKMNNMFRTTLLDIISR